MANNESKCQNLLQPNSNWQRGVFLFLWNCFKCKYKILSLNMLALRADGCAKDGCSSKKIVSQIFHCKYVPTYRVPAGANISLQVFFSKMHSM